MKFYDCHHASLNHLCTNIDYVVANMYVFIHAQYIFDLDYKAKNRVAFLPPFSAFDLFKSFVLKANEPKQ